MLKSIFHAAAAIAVAAMMTACFQREGEAVVNVASVPSSVVVPAASADDQPLRDTLVLSSNRSWTAKVKDLVDPQREITWVTLSQNEAYSISNTSFETRLVLTFEPNTAPKPRVCSIEIHSGKGIFTIPVKQTGAVEE